MNRLRVCHILEATLGGTRLHVVDLLRHLPQDQVENYLVYADLRADSAFLQQLSEIQQIATCIKVQMERSLSPISDLYAIIKLVKVMREHRFDVIHVHSGKAGLLGRVAALLSLTGAKVIYTPNASPFRLSRLYHIVEKVLSRLCHRIIAVSNSEREELIENGITVPEKVVTINSGIDVDRFRDALQYRESQRKKLEIGADELLIGTVARVSPQKAPLVFVEMIAKVAHIVPQAKFIWIGGGEDEQQLLEAVQHEGLSDRFILTGFISDIRPMLSMVDVFCLLSDYESFGYATVEAMAMGLAAVGTYVPGTKDVIVDGDTGFLVAKGDGQAAAVKVQLLCESPELRINFGQNGYTRACNEFAVQVMAARTMLTYREVTERVS